MKNSSELKQKFANLAYNLQVDVLLETDLEALTKEQLQEVAERFIEQIEWYRDRRVPELLEANTEYLNRFRALKRLVSLYQESLIWTTGSADFGFDGKAYVGYQRLVLPMLTSQTLDYGKLNSEMLTKLVEHLEQTRSA